MTNEKLGKALIVDDDASWQAILVEILEEIGLDVTVTDQVDEALRIINSENCRCL